MKSKTPLLFIIYSTLLVISIISLFSIKSKVISGNKELNWLNSQILQETNNIQILNAELAYLTTPERIDILQQKYLNLQKIEQKQIETLDDK
ncbi:hypothetical protein [Candidatus Aquarickettsia rohweri]|uniref:Cell division protein FtsL n=1 Tax=Candidatus Aquarickettsia rohweri TaxID=2602574 RepID=A0A3S0FMN0_9RICK|nr:hypothetical protein [Candidatus Aquarickettsia rohweri]MSO13621.1 hypothetical protein [Rickettsiales endosymbiont of Trichoplax sp. H2]RST65290.1 hypothetical protein EIC27_04300 [Candidatus Aquarickettsia rohweri]